MNYIFTDTQLFYYCPSNNLEFYSLCHCNFLNCILLFVDFTAFLIYERLLLLIIIFFLLLYSS